MILTDSIQDAKQSERIRLNSTMLHVIQKYCYIQKAIKSAKLSIFLAYIIHIVFIYFVLIFSVVILTLNDLEKTRIDIESHKESKCISI